MKKTFNMTHFYGIIITRYGSTSIPSKFIIRVFKVAIMKINNLKLYNFRNYETLSLEFSKKQNIIIGPNGSGKTNIVEAIYVLAITKSFRGSLDKILIRNGQKEMSIESTVKDKVKHNYKMVLSESGKIVKIDENRIAKLSNYISRINVVLFTPEDTNVIKDSPSSRRNMVNIEITQLENGYLHLLNEYNRILKQRNAFLKLMYINRLASPDYLWILTEQLITIGLKISEYRSKFIENINRYYDKINTEITKKSGLKVSYVSSYKNKTKEELMTKYKNYLEKDIVIGKTNIGIHHDDFIFSLSGHNLKDYGSEGEQKNAIVCFKLAEIEIFIKDKGIYPILILDDLFSELDAKKINNILKKLNKNLQIFITTTDMKNINTKILNNCTVFNIKKEKVVKKEYE